MGWRNFYWNAAVNRGVNNGTLKNYDLNRQGLPLCGGRGRKSDRSGLPHHARQPPIPPTRWCAAACPSACSAKGAQPGGQRLPQPYDDHRLQSVQTNAQANFGGELFHAPAGPVSFSTGVE